MDWMSTFYRRHNRWRLERLSPTRLEVTERKHAHDCILEEEATTLMMILVNICGSLTGLKR